MSGKKFFCLMSFIAAIILILVVVLSLPASKNAINKKLGAAVHYNLAKNLYEQGQYKEATEELSSALALNDKDSWVFLELGKNYIKLDKLDQAVKCFKKSINFYNNNIEAYINLAKIYNSRSEYDKAVKLLKPLESSNDNVILSLLAEAQYKNNDLKSAEKNFKKVISINSTKVDNFNFLGLIYLRQNKLSDAISMFRKVVSLDKTFVEARCNLAKALWFNDKPNYAIDELEENLGYNINYPETYYLLGKIYSQNGFYKKANDNFIKIFKINQVSIPISMLKDIAKELEIIAPKSRKTYIYNTLAITYTKLKDYNKAITAYERAIKLNTKDSMLYNNLASLYFQTNKIGKAIYYYKQALRFNPKESIYYYALGNCYKKLKYSKEAITNYNKALELNSSLNIARVALGDIYKEKQNLKMAEKLYNQALQNNSSEPYAYLGLSEIAMKQGMQSKAIKYKTFYLQIMARQTSSKSSK
ncbi:MAG: tetratricopeptide repeat protein [Candidatus Gastranaerophilales bacterium]|nr:tetratricopeptide repeat protein [Candidatus Gastranaerophilales bacterium]